MILTYHGWFNIICILIIIIFWIVYIIYSHKTRKNNDAGQIIFVDSFNITSIVGILMALLYFILLILCIIDDGYNSSSLVPLIGMIMWFSIFPSSRIVICEKGIGLQDLAGNISKLVAWNTPKEYKLTNNNRIKVVEIGTLKPKILLTNAVSNKNEIKSLLKKYDANYSE